MLIAGLTMIITAGSPTAEATAAVQDVPAPSAPFVRPPPNPEVAQSPSYRRFEKQPETRGYMVIVPTPPQANLQAAQGKPRWLEPQGGWKGPASRTSPHRFFRLKPRTQ
jgi:hypothetical protein